MSYTKTTWVNNTTPINETNLNKIEQGIYDNSLVVDAVTNTLNPTDTETYKTAELTEGQITDVIGVNDIVIKGQKSQDGEPTPYSPVDVNVVSGSNIINISNKNLLDISALTTRTIANVNVTNNRDGSFTLNGTSNSSGGAVDVLIDISLKKNTTYTFSKVNNTSGASYSLSLRDNSNVVINGTAMDSSAKSINFTLQSDIVAKYFRLYFAPNKTFTNHTIYPMLEINSTATPFTEHQGKEFPLDLPVENLLDNIFNQGGVDFGGTGGETSHNARIRSDFIPVKPNTTYTVSNHNSNIYQFGIGLYKSDKTYDSDHKINNGGWNNFPYTFTTQNNTYYVKIAFKKANDTTLSPTGDYKIMLSKGLLANAYTPYGTTPIELCKKGDYQDYFYRDNSKGKWYLHKEIGKDVVDENSTISIANTGTSNWFYQIVPNPRITTKLQTNQLCNYYVNGQIASGNTENGILKITNGEIRIRYGTEDTVANFKTWLALNNVKLYYILETATDTEITDTTLISQLEAIYNAPLYEQTNIIQENNDLPMILDITACKDNINGIKAFIRK